MLTSSRDSEGPLLREAFHLGGVAAVVTWSWVAMIDHLAGQPLHAFQVLGGVIAFTVVHCLVNFVYAAVIVAAARAADKAPSLVIALIFGFIMLEVAFAMVTAVLAQTGLGRLAWLQIFGGSLLSLAIVHSHLLRNYRMDHLLHRAESEL